MATPGSAKTAGGSAGEERAQRLRSLIEEARSEGDLARFEPILSAALREIGGPAAAADAGDTAAGRDSRGGFGMVGRSPAMEKVYGLLERVCRSDVPVLILGETGTGKELVAAALHRYGARAEKNFLAENCAAVPANLLESELFGHVKGSFTGAVADRPGHFVAADGGTVFLDEIGDMPIEMQAKLLRVLEEGEVRPVGSNKTRKVDVRIVAATNKDLPAMCAEKTFREDLYYRLNVVTIALAPLRERAGDVDLLVDHFIDAVGEEMGRVGVVVTPRARERLAAHSWPGNVRELENEIRRALALCPAGPDGSSTIDVEQLSESMRSAGTVSDS